MKRTLITFALASALLGCGASLPPIHVVPAAKPAGRAEPPRPPAEASFLGVPLRSGQLILTESPDATSFVFVLIPNKFYPFTHVAIVSVEDGEPFVYDVTGSVKTFPFRKRLMDNVTGKMYRRPLAEYVAPNLYAEIYEPPAGADAAKIAAYARQKYQEGVEFDSHFDFHDHSRMFCSELVALAVRAAGGPAIEPEPSNDNPSVIAGMKWLGVPPNEALAAGRFADPARFVGALGQFPNRTSAWLYFEAKRELYRRFTADQRLGFLLTLDGHGGVDVRHEITDFTTRAMHLLDREETAREPGDPRLAEVVRALADEMFGPFDDVAAAPPATTAECADGPVPAHATTPRTRPCGVAPGARRSRP